MAKDLFSKQAAEYAKSRPTYPKELIEYISSFVHSRHAAWDCATGNGQAALLLADHFEQVFATDLSTEQLKHAKPHPKVVYSASPAEHTNFANDSFDLITVAQAYHWFNQQDFCKEAKRVAKPGAIVAIWGYKMCIAADPEVNEALQSFYVDVTGPYWDEARKQIDDEYVDVYFDFNEIPVEQTFFSCEWSIDALEGYLNSWSAIQKYIAVNGYNPIDIFIRDLKPLWTQDTIEFIFPLFLRMGRVE